MLRVRLTYCLEGRETGLADMKLMTKGNCCGFLSRRDSNLGERHLRTAQIVTAAWDIGHLDRGVRVEVRRGSFV